MLLTLLTPPCGWKPGSPAYITETTVQPLMRGSLVWSREDCLGAKTLPQSCAEGRECSHFCGRKKPGEAISGEGPHSSPAPPSARPGVLHRKLRRRL